jgi:hypothetical protein
MLKPETAFHQLTNRILLGVLTKRLSPFENLTEKKTKSINLAGKKW